MQTTRTDRASGQVASQALVGDPNRPTLTSIIQRELDDFDHRPQRRARVVGRLIFLQAALLLMSAPLYFWPNFQPIAAGVAVVGLAFFGLTWVRNISGHVQQARAMLIAGSGLVTAASMTGQVLGQPGHILPVGLASFPFLLTILEAGLLYYPEIVLLTSAATAAFTALLFLVTLFVGSELRATDTYLLAVMTLGLQALSGIIAWQIAHFILDYSSELAQARREEFIVTQYDALRRTVEEQSIRLREQVVQVVQMIFALTNRNYTARAGVTEGDLKPVADALNVLAGQLSSFAAAEHAHLGATSAAAEMINIVGQFGDVTPGAGAVSGSFPPAAGTSSNMMQSAIATLQHARRAMQDRLGRVRDLAVDSGQRLVQVEDQARATSKFVEENMATIGHLRSEAERVHASATQLNDLIERTLNELSPLLPPEVSAFKRSEPREAQPVPLMPGVTIQLDTINDDTELGVDDIAPAYPTSGNLSPTGSLDATAQVKLREAWSLIVNMTQEVAKQVRDTNDLQDKLGITSRALRQVDSDLLQIRNAVAAVRNVAQQLYHTSNTATRPMTGPLPDVVMPPTAQPMAGTPSQPMPDVADAPPTQTTPGSLNAADLIDFTFNQGGQPVQPPVRPEGEPQG